MSRGRHDKGGAGWDEGRCTTNHRRRLIVKTKTLNIRKTTRESDRH
jgi:hypothetical protein